MCSSACQCCYSFLLSASGMRPSPSRFLSVDFRFDRCWRLSHCLWILHSTVLSKHQDPALQLCQGGQPSWFPPVFFFFLICFVLIFSVSLFVLFLFFLFPPLWCLFPCRPRSSSLRFPLYDFVPSSIIPLLFVFTISLLAFSFTTCIILPSPVPFYLTSHHVDRLCFFSFLFSVLYLDCCSVLTCLFFHLHLLYVCMYFLVSFLFPSNQFGISFLCF